ncbi:protein IMPAIRED IN BABA-INDUCED STERILITY 1 isoform X2 [Nicotiana tabacum]|uniref:Probable serine/threonine-protein kinase At1g54610 isoform X2 n=2 Tax=Nicotiana TaxID=4085 RepID=A0A1S4A007_TOBAC|nr:PREDICTED: probable serine/threonine-protein kinase At1g54610 isoform X2 [Nicotiana sylvestris]XP_016469963.1 PREDICTED: probable serine/threonine-protein kinase At1g54610 isoform X2 [Nicotiana tabacum]
MGCVSSKQATSHSPAHDSSSVTVVDNGDHLLHIKAAGFAPLEKIKEEPDKEGEDNSVHRRRFSGNLRRTSSSSKKGANSEKRATFSIKFGRLNEGEHLAAGWPAWLTAVAGEAIEGWMPLRSNMFQKLEKIGQGTYSSVYRARDIESGKMVALKKVRFNNFQPDSVRFMAREIAILRKLDHPNIMKLEGIITSRLSCSIYLVFEYMEHDLSGLLSCPDIKFTDSQIKCYMQQLLSGLEHCHSRGIMHRDIKVSNILVNNEGILKIADFGLANFLSSRHKQPLTSRVVTLWYRPPELLLGSTNYGVSVDLWSVGCVFAELFFGRPLLKGRTEVEQLHKIFKLCGTPPDDYWKKSKLPLATMFKPKQPYESTLRDRCKELPKTAVNLIETLLSIDPYKRGTASSALNSEYFNTKPYACDSSSLPKYPPNKEIDAKFREEARRKRASSNAQASETSRKSRKALQEPSSFCKVVPSEEVEANVHGSRRNHGGSVHISKGRRATVSRISMKPLYDTVSEASQMTDESQGDSTILSVPVQMPESSGFAWAKKGKLDSSTTRLYPPANSTSQKLSAVDPSGVLHTEDTWDSNMQDNYELLNRAHTFKHSIHRQHGHHERSDSFDSSDQEPSVDYTGQQGRVACSGPLLCQSQKFDTKQDSQSRKAGHRSRFYRDL